MSTKKAYPTICNPGTSRSLYKSRGEVSEYRDLLQRAHERFPNNIAYKYKKDYTKKNPEYISKTYQNVVDDVKAIGTKLLDLGLEGKKMILIGKNSYEWCTSYFAVTTSNMIIAPLDVALPDNEIENLVKRSGAEVMIFDKKFADLAISLANGKGKNKTNLKTLISMQDIRNPEILNLSKILREGRKLVKKGDTAYDNVKIDASKMSVMLFTSGTTDLPKIVMLSQNNICANVSAITQYVYFKEDDTLLSFLPLHHTFESTATFLLGFYSGSTVAFSDGLRYIQSNLQEYHATIFITVPLVVETMYKKIIKAIEDQGKTKLINVVSKISNALLKVHIDLRKVFFKQIHAQFGGKLRLLIYGSAPMDKKTIDGFNTLGIKQVQGYGLTETSPIIAAETDKEKCPGSVGVVLPNLQVKISRPNKKGIGEILVKGPSVMLGYYENEEETREAMKGGWFHTGDYGYLDENEFLYVTGRKKDVIVLPNGKNVYPQEIEFLINKFEGVIESIVYQRASNKTDTSLCAKIVYDSKVFEKLYGKQNGKDAYESQVWEQIKQLNTTLPSYKKIKHIKLTTKELPKTTTHKVKRYEATK